MLTAKEARAMMPDKDTIVNSNVQSICNDIQYQAQRGYTSYYFDRSFVYAKETITKLIELGYNVRHDAYFGLKVDWSEDND